MAEETKSDVQNQSWVFHSYPDPVLSVDNLKLVDVEMPTELSGENKVIVKTTYISVDPYMRGRMRKQGSGYASGFQIGSPIVGFVIGEIVKSNSPDLSEGDLVTLHGQWTRYFEDDAKDCRKLDMSKLPGLSPALFLGVLGLTGLSAYFPALEIAKPVEGDVVFVSGAAGAVGHVAGQIFKIKGCRVIGCAGTDEKVAMLKTIGYDEAFNYKTQDAATVLKEFSPEGYNVFWDNVGGPMLDTMLNQMKTYGRIVACGAISQYNKSAEERYGLKNTAAIIGKQLTWQGFLLSTYLPRAGEGIAALGGWLAEGKLDARETVSEGFDTVADALVGLFTGVNTGKMVVKV